MISALFAAALVAAAPVQAAPARSLAEALPITAKHEGVWRGTFRRVDLDGKVLESFPVEITVRFPRDGPFQYEQTNRYMPAGKPEVKFTTTGRFDGERIRFESPRVRGWAKDDANDPFGRTIILFIEQLDGSGVYVYESIHLSADGKHRYRVAQYFGRDGMLLRRTLVDEQRADAVPPQ